MKAASKLPGRPSQSLEMSLGYPGAMESSVSSQYLEPEEQQKLKATGKKLLDSSLITKNCEALKKNEYLALCYSYNVLKFMKHKTPHIFHHLYL